MSALTDTGYYTAVGGSYWPSATTNTITSTTIPWSTVAFNQTTLDEQEIEKRANEKAEKIAKDMLVEELKSQYRVKERGWGNFEGHTFFRNTLIECNGEKGVVVSNGYHGGKYITTNSYKAKYEKPFWIADYKTKIGEELKSLTPEEGDIQHDKRVSEIIDLFRKEEKNE